ncbi:hypothetical protein FQR65_LT14357 [Abscondita terminalis]|nr:hypothetical protein FQR65_LT14357 [Abscondita terminalis]
MATKLSKALFQRSIAYNRLLEIKESISKVSLDPSLELFFKAQLDEINEIYRNFKSAHNDVISLISDDAQFEIEDKTRLEADTAFYTIKAASLQMLKNNEERTSIPPNSNSLKLVKIALPVFNGNIKQWPTFIDLYNSLVHNSNLSNIEKFHYLSTSLSGEALNVIKGIPITDDNYLIAYNTLFKRYQNKRLLATYYYQEIFNAPSVSKSTSKELRQLLDTFNENFAALKNLGFPVDRWDFLLFNLLLNKLDVKTRTDFEFKYNDVEIPSYENLINFLNQNCQALEAVKYSSGEIKIKPTLFIPKNSSHSYNKHASSTFMSDTTTTNQCLACEDSHFLYKCPVFSNKTPTERFNFAKQHTLCINCLSSTHNTRSCPSKTTCRWCHAYHHTMLHFDKSNTGKAVCVLSSKEPSLDLGDNENINSESINVLTNATLTYTSPVLLSTATIEMLNSRGNYQRFRVLFDSGSMSNFISESCLNKLGLPRRHTSVSIEGLTGVFVNQIKGITTCNIKPCNQEAPSFTFDAYVLKNICSDQPKVAVDVTQWPHLRGVKFADHCFTPARIDLLIGAELLPYIFGTSKIFGQPDQPVAIETVFGWVLQGRATSYNKHASSTFMSDTTTTNQCLACEDSHFLYKCPVFSNKTPTERFNFAKQHTLCINCLSSTHNTRSCPSKTTCRWCHAYHHTMLHFDKSNTGKAVCVLSSKEPSLDLGDNENINSESINVLTNATLTYTSPVLLSTATIEMLNSRGNYQRFRVLFDSGSMSNFISESCLNKLGLPRRHTSVSIEGLTGVFVNQIKGITTCNIKPCNQEAPSFTFDAYVLKNICSDQPKVAVDVTQWPHLRGVKFADHCFTPARIDLLIGAELLPYIFGTSKIFGQPDQPVAIETVFGWVLQGRATCNTKNSSSLVSCHASVDLSLDLALEKFWEVETISKKIFKLSPEDARCEEIFTSSITRDNTGRFTVLLPFKYKNPHFGDTHSQALRRFLHLERRLCNNLSLYSEYSEFMPKRAQKFIWKPYPNKEERIVAPFTSVARTASKQTASGYAH